MSAPDYYMTFKGSDTDIDNKDKVGAIKMYRTLTGARLKQAKEDVEAAINGKTIGFNLDPSFDGTLVHGIPHLEALQALDQYGFKVMSANHREEVCDRIRQAARLALEDHDDQVALDLLETLTRLQQFK